MGGILSSVSQFEGQLNKIVVDGTTETPDFSLDIIRSRYTRNLTRLLMGPVAILQPVKAKLRNADFTVSGAVINIKGHGHRIDVDADIPGTPLQDFLDLSVKTEPPIMTGLIGTKVKLQIRPGKESVSQKLSLEGEFTLRSIHFSNPKVQDKVDALSLRAPGKPKEAKPGAEDVSSQMKGKFLMKQGVLHFGRLAYVLPDARVRLEGVYYLDGQQFEFHGKVLTEASLSHMVDSPWRSLLLKAISPFFKKREEEPRFR
jgi:hypothetical protein